MGIISKVKSFFVKPKVEQRGSPIYKPSEAITGVAGTVVGGSLSSVTSGYGIPSGSVSGGSGSGTTVMTPSGGGTTVMTPTGGMSVKTTTPFTQATKQLPSGKIVPVSTAIKKTTPSLSITTAKPKPFLEKYVIARTKTGGISAPGSLAKLYFETSEYVGEKTGLSKIGPKISKSKAIGIGSEVALYGGFAPAFAPTYAIEKSLFTPTLVGFKGTTIKIPETNLFKTDVGYQVSYGGKYSKGTAKGLTISAPTEKGITKSFTAGIGQTIKKGIEFPTGKIVTKTIKPYKGVSISLTKGIGGKSFVSISKGVVKEKKALTPFTSFDIGKVIGKKTISIGRTYPKSISPITTMGLIRRIPAKTPSNIFKTTGGFITKSRLGLKTIQEKQAISGLKGIVSASIKTQPAKILGKSIAKKGAVVGIASQFKLPSISKSSFRLTGMVTAQPQKQIQTPTQSNIFQQTSATKELQVPITTLKFKQQPLTKQKPRQQTLEIQQTKQAQRQMIKQIPKLKQITKQVQRGGFITPTTFKFPKPLRPIPFGFGIPSFLLPRGKTRRSKVRRKTKVRRQPSLWAIGSQIKSSKFGRIEGSGLSLRPIIISTPRRRVKTRRLIPLSRIRKKRKRYFWE